MLSINTNISSLIAQNSLNQSTNKLNQAIERMTTGAKINHAKDNAANYSINTNMTTKIGAYRVAEENTAMGMDMVATASENLDQMQNHATRLRALATQARNGTYGGKSLEAIQSEANAITTEIERLYKTTKYNGVNLLDNSDYPLSEHLQHKWGEFIAIPDFEETEGFTVKTLTDAYNEGSFDSSIKYSISNADELEKFAEMVNNSIDTTGVTFFLTNDIDLGDIDNWTPIGSSTNQFKGIFNGNGFVIDNLKIESSTKHTGFFSYNYGTIKNLALNNISVQAESGLHVGGLVGGNAGTIENCYVTGEIIGEYSVGGLVGANYITINNCYAKTTVKGTRSVGGLSGYNIGPIQNSYAKSTVYGDKLVGGLVGELRHKISSCYSYSTVNSATDEKGALVGGITINNNGNSYVSNLIIKDCFTIDKTTPSIGKAYQSTNSVLTEVAGYDLSTWQAGIEILEKEVNSTQLQIGTNGNWASNLDITLGFMFDFGALNNNIESDTMFSAIEELISLLSEKQTELGSVQNRLESVLDEISIQYENLVSSRSTIKDADIAKVSSQYIQQQILQQAAATLMATANQSPAIALQLI